MSHSQFRIITVFCRESGNFMVKEKRLVNRGPFVNKTNNGILILNPKIAFFKSNELPRYRLLLTSFRKIFIRLSYTKDFVLTSFTTTTVRRQCYTVDSPRNTTRNDRRNPVSLCHLIFFTSGLTVLLSGLEFRQTSPTNT